jgi:hypothetical protein
MNSSNPPLHATSKMHTCFHTFSTFLSSPSALRKTRSRASHLPISYCRGIPNPFQQQSGDLNAYMSGSWDLFVSLEGSHFTIVLPPRSARLSAQKVQTEATEVVLTCYCGTLDLLVCRRMPPNSTATISFYVTRYTPGTRFIGRVVAVIPFK